MSEQKDIYFASGVIARRELLSDSRLEEIRKTRDVNALKTLLSDTPYADLDFNRALKAFFEDLNALAPQLHDFFFYRYECHDCKIVFRMIDGQLTEDEAKDMMFSDDVGALAGSDVIKEASENRDVALEIIDRRYMERVYDEYRKRDIVRDVLEIEADYANTRSYLRLGMADPRISITFGKNIRKGLKLTELEEKLTRELEEKLDSFPYRYITTGFEPVFRYFYRRMREIDTVREAYLLRRAGL